MYGYPTSARPTALLHFYRRLACGLTYLSDHCVLGYECIYNDLVDTFVAGFFQNRFCSFFSLTLHTDRQVQIQTCIHLIL